MYNISDFEGCQLPCVPEFSNEPANNPSSALWTSFKRTAAYPWNNHIKKWLKKSFYFYLRFKGPPRDQIAGSSFRHEKVLVKGDKVRVRTLEEINSTLDPFKELKGCSFLPDMYQYCGTEQRIFKSMQYFLDERDYKLKKTRGLILLENIICSGTPVFGQCDRSCFLFWREEWLEKIE